MAELILESTNATKAIDRIAIVGAGGFGVSAALIAALSVSGVSIVNLADDRSHRRTDAFDSFDMVGLLNDLRRPVHLGLDLATRRELVFIDTPVPVSKRRSRRLRGKSRR